MKYPRATLAIILVLYIGSWDASQSFASDDVPHRDIEIYEAVLRQVYAAEGQVVAVGAQTVDNRTDERSPRKVLAEVRGMFPELDDETARSYLRSNSKSYRLPSQAGAAGLSLPVARSDRDEGKANAGSEAAAIVSFSRVGFNQEANQAFVYVEWSGKHASAGSYYLLQRMKDSPWLVVRKYTQWRSHGTRVLDS